MKQARRIVKRRHTMLYALLGAAFLLQNPAISHAEEEPVYSLEQVVVTANRVPTKASEVAANVDVISREQIEKGHYKSIGEILRGSTGVIVSGGAFPGSPEIVRINGDDRVLVLIDGRRIERPEGTGSGRAGIDLNSIVSSDNIERIEVMKGGASAIYGSDAVGGVINIITRKGSAGGKNIFDVSGGSWGQQAYNLSMQGSENSLGWFITATKKSQDYAEYNVLNPSLTAGSHKGDTYRWPNSASDSAGFTMRLDKTVDSNRSYTFNFEHWDSQSGRPEQVQSPSTDEASQVSNNLAFSYNFNQKEAVPGYARVYLNANKLDFQGGYRSRTLGTQYQTGWQAGANNKVITGMEWEKGTVISSQWRDYSGTILTNYSNQSTDNTALYLQDIYNYNKKITITPGLRYDYHSKFHGQTTPQINVNYKADAATDYYLSYNRVFKAPNLDDLYYKEVASWGNMLGNPNLKPEKGDVFSVGMNKKLSANTLLKLSYFTSDLTDAIRWDTSDYITWSPRNINREKKHGVELDLNHKFSNKYYTQIGYSYLNVKLDKGQGGGYAEDATNAQPRGYRFTLGYTDNKWNWNIRGEGAGGRNTSAFIDDQYFVWNVSADYKLSQNTTLWFKGYNLTNEAYELISSYNMTGVNGNYPMEARNFQLGIRYSF